MRPALMSASSSPTICQVIVAPPCVLDVDRGAEHAAAVGVDQLRVDDLRVGELRLDVADARLR